MRKNKNKFPVVQSTDSPLVSIIVLTFNSAKFVLDTLESTKNQTYKNIELIISDDCSVDDTLQICTRWLKKNKQHFKNVQLISATKNKGIPANCNQGLRAGKGSWIKFIAADDYLLPTCIEDNIDYMVRHKDVYAVQSECELYKNNFTGENFIGCSDLKNNSLFRSGITAKEQYDMLLKHNHVKACSMFLKKTAVNNVGGFDETIPLTEDWPMWLKLTNAEKKIQFFNKVTVKYRISDNSVMKNNKPFMSERYAKGLLNLSKKYRKGKVGAFYYYKLKLSLNGDIILNRLGMNKNTLVSRILFTATSLLR